MRQRKPWLASEDALIARLRGEGRGCGQIAEVLNRSLSSTKTRVDRLIQRGVLLASRKGWAPSEYARIIDMRDQGASTREIAKVLGRPFGSTANHVHELIERGALRRLAGHEAKSRWHRERSERSEHMGHVARKLVTNIPPTRDWGYVIGVLFGDGFILKSGRTIGLKCTNASFADAFARSMFVSFGEMPRRIDRTEPEKRLGERVYYNVRYYEVMLHRRHIARALKEWIGPTSTWDWSIDVTDTLGRGPEFCDGLIQGLYDSDGSVTPHGLSGLHIRLGTASERGARSLHELMTRRGFDVGFNARRTRNEYRVDVHASSCVRYASEISSRVDYKKERLDAFLARCAPRPAEPANANETVCSERLL
jgi:hypothetical protein